MCETSQNDGQPITKQGKYCRLVEGGSLAGSVSNLRECMVNAVKEMNLPLETVVACATINPAQALGIDDVYGSIEDGKKVRVSKKSGKVID